MKSQGGADEKNDRRSGRSRRQRVAGYSWYFQALYGVKSKPSAASDVNDISLASSTFSYLPAAL